MNDDNELIICDDFILLKENMLSTENANTNETSKYEKYIIDLNQKFE